MPNDKDIYLPDCAQLILTGEYTKTMSKDQVGHFNCWHCDEPLTGKKYVLRDDHGYCLKCYDTVFANVCQQCSKPIGLDSKVSHSCRLSVNVVRFANKCVTLGADL